MPRKKRTDYYSGYFMPSYILHITIGGMMHLVEQHNGKRVGIVRTQEDSHGGIFAWPVGGGCYYLMDDEIKRERDQCAY